MEIEMKLCLVVPNVGLKKLGVLRKILCDTLCKMCGEPVPSIQSDVKIALDCRDRK